MACDSGNVAGDIIKGFFDFLGDPIGTIMEGIANLVLSAAIAAFGGLTTSVPTLSGDGTAGDISDETQWIVVYTAVGSLIFAAARMALERRGEAGATAMKGLLRVILVAGGATAVVSAMARLSDRYADHLFKTSAQQQLANVGCSGGDGIQAVLLLVLAFLLLIAAIVQTILLYVRLGVMILLLGTLPLAAAASMTDWGSGWWRKHTGWMIAWLLYKPAAGLVIFSGSAMISSGDDSGANVKIAGIGVLLLSAVALPALLKLVVPATAALGTGGGLGDVASMAGSVASGARNIGSSLASKAGSGGGGSGGGSGESGSAAPSGASSAGGEGGQRGESGGSGGGSGSSGGKGKGAPSPASAALGAAASVAKGMKKVAGGAVDGADGERGHNR